MSTDRDALRRARDALVGQCTGEGVDRVWCDLCGRTWLFKDPVEHHEDCLIGQLNATLSATPAGAQGAWQPNGWAVSTGGKIDIRTVSPTRRAAIVNWLVTVPLVAVAAHYTDEWIEQSWRNLREKADVIEVQIAASPTAARPADGAEVGDAIKGPINGSGFERNGGGFELIHVGDAVFTAAQVRAALNPRR